MDQQHLKEFLHYYQHWDWEVMTIYDYEYKTTIQLASKRLRPRQLPGRREKEYVSDHHFTVPSHSRKAQFSSPFSPTRLAHHSKSSLERARVQKFSALSEQFPGSFPSISKL